MKYFEGILKLGGIITAEQRDGLSRLEFIKNNMDQKTVKYLKKLKNILNWKIFSAQKKSPVSRVQL